MANGHKSRSFHKYKGVFTNNVKTANTLLIISSIVMLGAAFYINYERIRYEDALKNFIEDTHIEHVHDDSHPHPYAY